MEAGGHVNITARGAGENSSIKIEGSRVKAAGDVTLQADGDVQLLAAKNTVTQQSDSKSSSAAVGLAVSFNQDGAAFGVTASVSAARGNADGHDETWTDTEIAAGNTLTIKSGGNTLLKGASSSSARPPPH